MKPGMILYREELGMMLLMEDEELAEAMRLLIKRFMFDEEPETENMKVDYLLRVAIPKQKEDEEAYLGRVEAARKAGKASRSVNERSASVNDRSTSVNDRSTAVNKQEQEQEQEREQEQEHKKNGRMGAERAFRPPTLEEVRAYVESRGNRISAERFYDHYSANGWKVGRNPMKDWKSAARNWERNEFADKKPKDANENMQTHGWDYDALQAQAVAQTLGVI